VPGISLSARLPGIPETRFQAAEEARELIEALPVKQLGFCIIVLRRRRPKSNHELQVAVTSPHELIP
jgi:hypothetical protein